MGIELLEHYTYDDYKLWDGDWELIEGLPIAMSPAPVRKHQGIAAQFIIELGKQVEQCKRCEVLGEEDWRISYDTVVRPDVVLICDEPHEDYITKAPEVVVEVISKTTARKDETYKFALYESEKVPYYILVYPDDLKAKLYKNINGKFVKQGDFFSEAYCFEGLPCDVEVNFEKVFKKYKDKSIYAK